MYRVQLTDAQRDELTQRTRAPELQRRTRDRLEYVWLADAGWSIPKIATFFRAEEDTVRYWVKRFLVLGFDALTDQPDPGQTSRLTPLCSRRCALASRSKTAPGPGNNLPTGWQTRTHGLRLSADHLGFLLRRARITCPRTERSLRHAQDPDQVAEREADLGTVEQGGVRLLRRLPRRRGRPGFDPASDHELGTSGRAVAGPAFRSRRAALNLIGGYFTQGPQAGDFQFALFASLPTPRGPQGKDPAENLAQRALKEGLASEDVG